MSNLPQVYWKYDLLFTPLLISQLRDLRSEEWMELINTLASLPETHPDTLAFAIMMINLCGCLSCERDSHRAQQGCATCARQTIISFKGNDKQLIKGYENACQSIYRPLSETDLKRAA